MSEQGPAYLDQAAQALARVLQDRPIAYHPVLARAAGSVTAGILLSQLLYWTGKSEDGWVYRTQAQIEEETALTRREQETARRDLRSLEVVVEEKRGLPARLFYKVNIAALTSLLANQDSPTVSHPRVAESAKQVGTFVKAVQPLIPALETSKRLEDTPPKLLGVAVYPPAVPDVDIPLVDHRSTAGQPLTVTGLPKIASPPWTRPFLELPTPPDRLTMDRMVVAAVSLNGSVKELALEFVEYWRTEGVRKRIGVRPNWYGRWTRWLDRLPSKGANVEAGREDGSSYPDPRNPGMVILR